MKIIWNKVTTLSKIVAVIVYIATLGIGFYFGEKYGEAKTIISQAPEINQNQESPNIINALFTCDEEKEINALFYDSKVELSLSDGRNFLLLQGISASGARYVNENETLVFWNKGDTAFLQEDEEITYDNCLEKQ